MMPPLPRVLKKKEAHHTPAIMKMMLQKYGTCAVEVKRRGNKVLPHQMKALKAVTSKEGFAWKLPDYGNRNPFDFFCMKNIPSFIVWIEKDGSLTVEKVLANSSLS